MMANDDDTTNGTTDTPEEAVEKVDLADTDPEETARAEDFAETFKTAAQKVLEDRFGMQQNADGSVDFTKIDSDKVKANAQSLITGLMSQLAGVTTEGGDSAEAKPSVPANVDDNVIDLEAARRARAPREPSELEQRISNSLKTTFDAYLKDHLVPEDAQGEVQLHLDGEMLKEHGPQLLTALFGAFTGSLFPEEGVQVNVGGGRRSETQPAEGDEADGEASDAGEGDDTGSVDVKLNVDLAGMFRGLLDSVKPKA